MTKFDISIYKELGKLLKVARENKNISLDTLSNLLNGHKTKSTLKRYEDGVSRIDMETLHKICNILGQDANSLIDEASSLAKVGNTTQPKTNITFTNVDEAMLFIIQNPTVAAYGGYDLDKMSDQDKIDFANQIADSIKFFGQKFNK